MEIVTDRLRLRQPEADDAPAALALLQDPDTARWNPAPEVVDVVTARDWCVGAADWSAGNHATWHAVDPGTEALVGTVSVFAIDRLDRTAKIGYRIAPAFRGQGLGTEAVVAVTEWAFTSHGIERLQLEHNVDNVASCIVATRAGYRLEGLLRSACRHADGSRVDDHVHGRLAADPRP